MRSIALQLARLSRLFWDQDGNRSTIDKAGAREKARGSMRGSGDDRYGWGAGEGGGYDEGGRGRRARRPCCSATDEKVFS